MDNQEECEMLNNMKVAIKGVEKELLSRSPRKFRACANRFISDAVQRLVGPLR